MNNFVRIYRNIQNRLFQADELFSLIDPLLLMHINSNIISISRNIICSSETEFSLFTTELLFILIRSIAILSNSSRTVYEKIESD